MIPLRVVRVSATCLASFRPAALAIAMGVSALSACLLDFDRFRHSDPQGDADSDMDVDAHADSGDGEDVGTDSDLEEADGDDARCTNEGEACSSDNACIRPLGGSSVCCAVGYCLYAAGRPIAVARRLGAGETIVIDGYRTEWSSRVYPLTNLQVPDGVTLPSETDLRASFRVQWDDEALYLLVRVDDSLVTESVEGRDWWCEDSAEVMLDVDPLWPGVPDDRFDLDEMHAAVVAEPPNSTVILHQSASDASWVLHGQTTKVGSSPRWTWQAELRIEWPTALARPGAGDMIGLELAVNDRDTDDGPCSDVMIAEWSQCVVQPAPRQSAWGLVVLGADDAALPECPVGWEQCAESGVCAPPGFLCDVGDCD